MKTIEIAHTTPDKPQIDQISSILGIDHDSVTGKLVRLWIWADQQGLDRLDIDTTESLIDRITFCDGFAAALRSVGWLHLSNERFSIPSFNDYEQTAKQSSALIPPCTVAQANAHAAISGIDPAAAEMWWLDCDGRGWLDARGQIVRNWQSSLTAYGRRWQANDFKYKRKTYGNNRKNNGASAATRNNGTLNDPTEYS